MSFKSQLSKYLSFHMELLLLAAPIIFFVVFSLFYQSLSVDPYFSLSIPFILSNNLLFLHAALFLIPYLIHRFLRDQNKYEPTFCFLHILFSLFLLLALLFTYQLYTPLLPNTNRIISPPPPPLGMEATVSTYIVLLTQLIVQGLFTVYGLLLLIPIKKKNLQASYS